MKHRPVSAPVRRAGDNLWDTPAWPSYPTPHAGSSQAYNMNQPQYYGNPAYSQYYMPCSYASVQLDQYQHAQFIDQHQQQSDDWPLGAWSTSAIDEEECVDPRMVSEIPSYVSLPSSSENPTWAGEPSSPAYPNCADQFRLRHLSSPQRQPEPSTTQSYGTQPSISSVASGRVSKSSRKSRASRVVPSAVAPSLGGLVTPDLDNLTMSSPSEHMPSDYGEEPPSEAAYAPVAARSGSLVPSQLSSHLITPELRDSSDISGSDRERYTDIDETQCELVTGSNTPRQMITDINTNDSRLQRVQVQAANALQTGSPHLQTIRAIQTLCIPGIPQRLVPSLLEAARISPDDLLWGPYQGQAENLPFVPFCQSTSAADPDHPVISLVMQPNVSVVPELFMSYRFKDGPAPQGSTSNLMSHRTRFTSMASAWDPHEVCYPLGFVPMQEWITFEDEFGPNFATHIFDPVTFVRPPHGDHALRQDGEICRSEWAAGGPRDSQAECFFELDRYDPVWIRVHPRNGRESWCGTCDIWQKRDKSNWLHHMKSHHGVRSMTAMSYPLPYLLARRPDRDFRVHKMYIAYCEDCRCWQNLNNQGGRAPLSSWFLHLASHDVTRNRQSNGPGRKRSKKCVSKIQIEMERLNFDNRRRMLADIQLLIKEQLRVNGDVGQFCTKFFKDARNFELFDVPT